MLISHLVPLPAVVTACVTGAYMLFALAGAGTALAALIMRRWWALVPLLLCGFFLWVQGYWFYEWIT
jgi:hypothetical protein